jgi:sec-independent protein translocase protein TatA
MNIVASIGNLFEGSDLIIILIIVLLLFGAKRLPELARGLGQAVNEFSKAKDDVRRQITRADEPVVQQPQGVQSRSPETAPPAPAPDSPAKTTEPKPLA